MKPSLKARSGMLYLLTIVLFLASAVPIALGAQTRERPDLDGKRYLGSDGTAYLIDHGLRRALTSKADANLFGGNNFWHPGSEVDLMNIPEGNEMDDAYLVKDTEGTLYLMDHTDGTAWIKRPITAQGSTAYGFVTSGVPIVLSVETIGDTIDASGTAFSSNTTNLATRPDHASGGRITFPTSQSPAKPNEACTVTVAEKNEVCSCANGSTTTTRFGPCHSCRTNVTGQACGGVRCESCYAVCGGGTPSSQSCPN